MSRAYYNEIDPAAAAWIRELIADGQIPPGDVDERSVTDVSPDDLAGYVQCHFFCGIAGWPYALRLAGWPDDKPVWTGSAPCQPFSVAGKAGGVGDERHLWPAFLRLIAEQRPSVVLGEQVASKDGRLWLAGVRLDLERVGYAVGAADLAAAGVGAPHIRQRLYWVADAERNTRDAGRVAERPRSGDAAAGTGARLQSGRCGDPRGLAGGIGVGLEGHAGHVGNGHEPGRVGAVPAGHAAEGRASGFWSNSTWLPCRDGKARRVEPGIFPLVAGLPRGVVPGGDPGEPGYADQTAEARVMRLRGYGNAICAPLAAEFIAAYMEAAHA